MAQAIVQCAFESHGTRTVLEVHCVDIDSHILAEVSRYLHLSNNSKPLSSKDIRDKLLAVCWKGESSLEHVDAPDEKVKRRPGEAGTVNETHSMGESTPGHNKVNEPSTTEADIKLKTKTTKEETKARQNRRPDESARLQRTQDDPSSGERENPSTADRTTGHGKASEYITSKTDTKVKTKTGMETRPKRRHDEPSSKETQIVDIHSIGESFTRSEHDTRGGDTEVKTKTEKGQIEAIPKRRPGEIDHNQGAITADTPTQQMHTNNDATQDKIKDSVRGDDNAAIVEQIADGDIPDIPDGARRTTSPQPNKTAHKASSKSSAIQKASNKSNSAYNDFTYTNIKYPGSYLSHTSAES